MEESRICRQNWQRLRWAKEAADAAAVRGASPRRRLDCKSSPHGSSVLRETLFLWCPPLQKKMSSRVRVDDASDADLCSRVSELGVGDWMIDGDVLFVKSERSPPFEEWILSSNENGALVFASHLQVAPSTEACTDGVLRVAKAMMIDDCVDLRCLAGMPRASGRALLRRLTGLEGVEVMVAISPTTRRKRPRRRSSVIVGDDDEDDDCDLIWLGSRGTSVRASPRDLDDKSAREDIARFRDGVEKKVWARYPCGIVDEVTVWWSQSAKTKSFAALCAPPIEIDRVSLRIDATRHDGLHHLSGLLEAAQGRYSSIQEELPSVGIDGLWPELSAAVLVGDIAGARLAFDNYVAVVSSGEVLPALPDFSSDKIVSALSLSRDAAAALRYGGGRGGGDRCLDSSAELVWRAAVAVDEARDRIAQSTADLGVHSTIHDLQKVCDAGRAKGESDVDYARRLSKRVYLQERARRAGLEVAAEEDDFLTVELTHLSPSLRAELAEPTEWTCSAEESDRRRFVRVLTSPNVSFNPPLSALMRAQNELAKENDPLNIVKCLLGQKSQTASLKKKLSLEKNYDPSSSALPTKLKKKNKPLVLFATTLKRP